MTPNTLGAAQAAARIAAGELSAESLVGACLARTAAREPLVRAWAYLDAERALERARALDRAPPSGPLHGVPFGIKDIFDTADMPTECGSAALHGRRPQADAACVARLRAAGAVPLGKTVTSEFAAYHPGPTRNPRDLARTTGISSMGSSAAVADGMVPLALASQTGGSIIRPAAFCGVLGCKPGFGVIARTGVQPLAGSLDTVGFMVRELEDLRLLYRVLASGLPGVTPSQVPALGICRTHAWTRASDGIRECFEGALARLSGVGLRLVDVDLPAAFATLNDDVSTVLAYEGARNLQSLYRERRAELGPSTIAMVERGLACPGERHAAALARLAACRQVLPAVFAGVDALVTPAAECEPPPLDQPSGDSVFNRLWTGLHVPCLSLPALPDADGLASGLQLVGAPGGDLALLDVAQTVARALR